MNSTRSSRGWGQARRTPTDSALSRRTVLRGAGAALALPFFESLLPRSLRLLGSRAEAAEPPQRLLFYFLPNGIHMPAWTPKTDGRDYTLSPILAPLAPFKDQLLVLSGLSNRPARPDGAGDHAGGTSAFLTCTKANKSDSDIRLGVSVDQLAAQGLAGGTRFPSLQLGLEGGSSGGVCDSGYSCAYTTNISWAGPRTPLPKLSDPRIVFDVLFRGEDAGQTPEQIERRRRTRKSVLDHVLADAGRLQGRLGGSDRRKLDEYLTAVRSVEQRLGDSGPSCGGAKRPAESPRFDEIARSMADLIVLALSCDLSRVVSYMWGNGLSNRSYSFIGVPGAHHELSHHQNNPDTQAKLQAINTYEMQVFAYLLDGLSRAKEGAGSLLDRTLICLSSDVSDGNSHSHDDMPVLLAGHLGTAIQPGRHLRYPGQPLANLYLTLLAAIGHPQPRFGDDGTAQLTGLGAG